MQALKKIGLRSSESSRSPLWLWPTVTVVASALAALLLSRYRPTGAVSSWLWFSDTTSATSTLQAISTAVMSATTIVFSLTLVTLQLASQQFSPRLLRQFDRDAVTKVVLSVLVGCFAYTLTLQRQIRSDAVLPALAMVVAYLFALAATIAILAFIAHVTRMVRVDTIMRKVHDDSARAMDDFYPDYGDASIHVPEEAHLNDSNSRLITSNKSGFVRMTDVRHLVKQACEQKAIIRIEVRPGDHISRKTPLASVWKEDRSQIVDGEPFIDSIERGVRDAVIIGYERTIDQDAAFGFRQLEDIAVKAMSPGINDPATAATAVAHMGDMLVTLCDKRLGPTLHLDDDGIGRVIVPDRNFAFYLDTACSQLRRFASAEPSVLAAMMQMLRDVAVACRDENQRSGIRESVSLILKTMDEDLLPSDAQKVHDMARRVELALRGQVLEAFADGAGETRTT